MSPTLFITALGLLYRAAAHYLIIPFDNPPPDGHPGPPIVGPDGPWYGITVTTGANPMDFVTMLPTFDASTSWFVGAVNCEHSNQSCVQPQNTYYESTSQSALYTPPLDTMENSSAVQFGDIYQPAGSLLNTTGSFGYWHAESLITAPNTGDPNPYFVRGMSQVASNYTSVRFPNGASYVPPSFFTLDPGILNLPSRTDGSPFKSNLITNLYNSSSIASVSWAMHIGSVAQNINGSLVLGSYDQTRLIGNPGIFSSSGVKLTSLTLGASSGGFNWSSPQMGQNYLGRTSSGLDISINTAIPYLYLPADVCSSLSQVLPITFDSRFNIYTWQIKNDSYSNIVSSPAYLNFTFQTSDNKPLAVRVPFALLNLTLGTPLVTTPIPYFPCSPTSAPLFALGRAFLQAAFIGQNYNSSTFWLGQAPGPTGIASDPTIKTINPADTQLIADSTAQTWEESWAGVLKVLPPQHQYPHQQAQHRTYKVPARSCRSLQ